jgi:competence ComEA-like helix-hairpin-helix protein
MGNKNITATWILFLFAAGFFCCGIVCAQTKTPVKPGARIDLNRATAEQLSRGQGLNEALGRAIVEFREKSGPLKAPEDLLKVKGITKEIFNKINPKMDKGILYVMPAASDEDEEEPSLKPSKC